MNVELITLGTAAGPAIRGTEPGISSAVVVNDDFYLIDFGLGCTRAAAEAGLKGRNFKGGFITHLHSDHVVELPGFLLWNWGKPVEGFTESFPIIGPAKDPHRDGGEQLAGTHDLVANTLSGFAYDIDIRIQDEARPDLHALVQAREIEVPNEPIFEIYQDDNVHVTATLVEHPPVFPAFAFRFDTAAGSIVFSGDTAKSQALVELARGADVLVHEAVNLDFYRERNFSGAFLNHQACSHTSPEDAGDVAAAAGVQHLVLSHLAGVAPAQWWHDEAAKSFTGQISVARSGNRYALSQLSVR
ncbi:MBL fold metallo-hydrolase [Micrococcoides hystricis]|uniref:MBL fold metallo-hydrolase n=1 Tax=Micrococcoides hystricis TaxID=1572761 RepID=A0ABV6PCE5_9MICC